MDDPEELYNCGNGFTHERCIDMTPGSPDPRQPDPSFTEYPPYPQADPPRQYGYPTPPSGPHNQHSSIFQRPTPYEQMPFLLAGNQPLHGTAKQSAIARKAAIIGIVNGGAALCGTVLAIEITIFNIPMGYATPSITSLLAIALGSLITHYRRPPHRGDFLPARTRIQDVASHGPLPNLFCAIPFCNAFPHRNTIYRLQFPH